MTTSLLKLQQEFAALVPRLIDQAGKFGMLVTLGDAYRDPRVFGKFGEGKGYGNSNSVHKLRLAIDLNLFSASGKFLDTTGDHAVLGAWWKAQHPNARWGGDFNDGNHYSFEYNGVK